MTSKTVKKKDVPEELCCSEKYQNCEKDTITIPIKYWITDLKLDDLSDFKQLVETLYYWNVYQIPHIVYKFIESTPDADYENILMDLSGKNQPMQKKSKITCRKCGREQVPCVMCCKCTNYFNTVVPKIKEFVNSPSQSLITHAARRGFLDIIVYKHKQYLDNLASLEEGEYIPLLWDTGTCSQAAWNGHFHVLKYLHENKCPWSGDTIKCAAWHGHYDCLEYAIKNSCPYNVGAYDAIWRAAQNGYFECVKLLRKHKYPYDDRAVASAAFYNRIEMLKWMIKDGASCSCEVFSSAASNGSYESMVFLLSINCPWSEWTHYHAKCCWNMYGNPQIKNAEAFKETQEIRTKCLKLLEDNGCPKYVKKSMMERLRENRY
jgi:hypothetical protein